MRLEVVTPEARTFSDEVESVVVPGSEGEMGVLPAHAPLVSPLKPGELRYTKDGEEHALAVGNGVVEIGANHVSVLTDLAIGHADIDEDAVEQALNRAQLSLEDHLGDEDRAAVEEQIMKAIAMLEVKRRAQGKNF